MLDYSPQSSGSLCTEPAAVRQVSNVLLEPRGRGVLWKPNLLLLYGNKIYYFALLPHFVITP